MCVWEREIEKERDFILFHSFWGNFNTALPLLFFPLAFLMSAFSGILFSSSTGSLPDRTERKIHIICKWQDLQLCDGPSSSLCLHSHSLACCGIWSVWGDHSLQYCEQRHCFLWGTSVKCRLATNKTGSSGLSVFSLGGSDMSKCKCFCIILILFYYKNFISENWHSDSLCKRQLGVVGSVANGRTKALQERHRHYSAPGHWSLVRMQSCYYQIQFYVNSLDF